MSNLIEKYENELIGYYYQAANAHRDAQLPSVEELAELLWEQNPSTTKMDWQEVNHFAQSGDVTDIASVEETKRIATAILALIRGG